MNENKRNFYICFSIGTQARIALVSSKPEGGISFGPFADKKGARKLYDYMVRAFKLNTCDTRIPHGCIDYHIGVCAGTCIGGQALEEYLFRLKLAQASLAGDYQQYVAILEESMKKHNLDMATWQAILKNVQVLFKVPENKRRLPLVASE